MWRTWAAKGLQQRAALLMRQKVAMLRQVQDALLCQATEIEALGETVGTWCALGKYADYERLTRMKNEGEEGRETGERRRAARRGGHRPGQCPAGTR